MIMVLINAILSTEAVPPPGVDVSKKRVFDPQLAVWAAYNAFPDQFLDASKNWVKAVQENKVDGEVLSFIVPNYQIHCESTFCPP